MGTWLINNAADGFGIALTAELLERGHAVAGIVRDRGHGWRNRSAGQQGRWPCWQEAVG
ncbi:hypothetical protein [Herbaspirillum sp. YR522]|uniref:hypothetical protein n=1 Tax=Herbaspirillum sp. YR522 TaxID=1144342 RepID=UPI0012FB6DBE|nr:hypothetical protein [Herbaspirillum sp. YR522]